jgi:TRAP-type C4-dicarboxylate transport system substrate-binding protein
LNVWRPRTQERNLPVYFGTRQVNLRTTKKVNTPADMAGVKLRMPPGEVWQLLGEAMGANPTPVAFAELYTALQTGAVDGQDNPLPNVNTAKLYEVMSQIVLTSHIIGYDVLVMNLKSWNAMGPAKQKTFQAAVDKAMLWCVQEHVKREGELADTFKKAGLDIYTPDVNAFRAYAQKVYLASDEAKAWPAGVLEKINALK